MTVRPVQYSIDENGQEIVLVPLDPERKYYAKLYADDYERLLKLGVTGEWSVHNNGSGRLYVTVRSKINAHHIIVARLIANPLPGYSVYYKNGDTLDLRRDNLEIRKCAGFRRDSEHFTLTKKDLKELGVSDSPDGTIAPKRVSS
jgi:hypothetical protein